MTAFHSPLGISLDMGFYPASHGHCQSPYPSNYARPLTEALRVRIQQLAANGRVLDGVVLYVEGRLGQDMGYQAAFALEDPEAFACDPAIRAVLEEAAVFCWECARVDYSPTPARRRFIGDYCAGRFVTLALLDAAWEECKRAEKDAMRSAMFEQVGEKRTRNEIPSEQLDGLDDASISDLYLRTLRERAHGSRRQNGVLV